MQVLVSLSQRFVACQGRLYAPTCAYSPFCERYLEVFDQVLILGRVSEVDVVKDGLVEVTGPGVDFIPLPDYHGPWQYWAKRHRLQQVAAHAVGMADAFLLRVPCHVGGLVWRELQRRGLPYGVEVVADPWLSLAPGGVKSITRPVARRVATRELRRQCHEAIAATYVTKFALQRAYPPGPSAYALGCSDVILPDSAIVSDLSCRQERLRAMTQRLRGGGDPVRLGYAGTFDALYKAPDVHIEALAECRRRGLNVELMMVGEGRHRPEMEKLAHRCGVGDSVTFTGRLPAGEAMLEYFDQIDLFLNASRQEGLPRTLVEAMARGCPAIGSDISGIPELLPPDCLVQAGRGSDLAVRIVQILQEDGRCAELAVQNRDRAREYRASVLNERRREFYSFVRNRTAQIRSDSEKTQRKSSAPAHSVSSSR